MEKKSIKKNYIYQVSYQILSIIVPFITTPYVSRVLGPAGVGTYSYSNSIASYFVLVASLGLATFGQREVAYYQDDLHRRSQAFWEVVVLKTMTSLLALAAYISFLFMIKQNNIVFYIFCLNIIGNLFDISWYFQGMENFQIIVIRNMIFKIINIAYIFCFIKTESDLPFYVLGICGFNAVNAISLWPILYGRIVWTRDIHPFRNLRAVIELFAPTIAFQIYAVLDKTMIGLVDKSGVENGCYEQAEKIILMAKMLFTSLSTVMLPRMASMLKSGQHKEVKYFLSKACGFDWILGAPVMLGLISISDILVPLFLGPGFEKSVIIMIILSPIIIVTSISGVIGYQYLIASGKQNVYTLIVFFSAGCNFLFNSFFIPKYFATGAALGSIFAEIIIFIILVIYMQIQGALKAADVFKYAPKPIIASVIMAILLRVLKQYLPVTWMALFFMVACGAIIYSICLTIFKDELFLENVTIVFEKVKKR